MENSAISMNNRLSQIYSELLEKCTENQTFEFEYFIEIDGINQSFTFNDISSADLDELVKSVHLKFVRS